MQHSIRFANVADAASIEHLFAELGHDVSASSLVSRWAKVCPDNDAILVAETGGQITGMVSIDQFEVIHRDDPVGRVTALIVAPGFRGRGIGGELLRAAECHLLSRGCCRIEIVSNLRYAHAHRFYEHLDYESSGVRLHKDINRAAME